MTDLKAKMQVLLRNAAQQERGLIVEVNNINAFKRYFYAARKRLGLTDLSLRMSPDRSETQVWLVRTSCQEQSAASGGGGGQQDPDEPREVEAASSNPLLNLKL